MSLIPRLLLSPLAKALAAIFYNMVAKSSDSQRSAAWEYDHWSITDVPLGYKARVRLDLVYDEKETAPPKRRATDVPGSVDA